MAEELFLYSVNPRRVITGLSEIKAIRTPKSVLLSKDEVYTCLKKATVYRRFASEGINERVTIANVDRVHRANYISEEEWKKMNANDKEELEEEPTRSTQVNTNNTIESVSIEKELEEALVEELVNDKLESDIIENAESLVTEDEVESDDEDVDYVESLIEEEIVEESNNNHSESNKKNRNNQFKYNKKK